METHGGSLHYYPVTRSNMGTNTFLFYSPLRLSGNRKDNAMASDYETETETWGIDSELPERELSELDRYGSIMAVKLA